MLPPHSTRGVRDPGSFDQNSTGLHDVRDLKLWGLPSSVMVEDKSVDLNSIVDLQELISTLDKSGVLPDKVQVLSNLYDELSIVK